MEAIALKVQWLLFVPLDILRYSFSLISHSILTFNTLAKVISSQSATKRKPFSILLTKEYDIVLWAYHGAFASGIDFDRTIGLMHTVEKASEILVKVLSMVCYIFQNGWILDLVPNRSVKILNAYFFKKYPPGWLVNILTHVYNQRCQLASTG